MLKVFVLAIVSLVVSNASAGVMYLPVQYEYGVGNNKYYYGGSDPAVFARAERANRAAAITRSPDRINLPARTYSDDLPYQPNAAVYGFSANDARLAAYQAVPRYFRMTNVPTVGRIDSDEVRVNPPASRGTIEIKPYIRPTADPATRRVLSAPTVSSPSSGPVR